jgi:anti-sigma B factor antagonist
MTTTLPLLALSALPDRDRVRVVAAGEVDLFSVGRLRDQLAELFAAGWHDVVADLREVRFMDSSGVHALLEADRNARAGGARLTVMVEPGPISDLLELTGTDRVLTLA